MGRAIYHYLQDLGSGDPVALGLTAFFLLLLSIPTAIWVIDMWRRRKNDARNSKKRRSLRKDKP